MSSFEQESTLSFNKPFCKLGRQCPVFVRFVDSNDYRSDDIDHCSNEFHPGRRGGMTVEENFQSKRFITAFQSCTKVRAHLQNRNFWCGKVSDGDLTKEIERNGFENVLTPNLYKRVTHKLAHDRHTQIGSPLSFNQMLAVLLYTDTKLYEELRLDERLFSMQDVTHGSHGTNEQKWPVFGRILNATICCLNKYDAGNRPATVYHGLHGIIVDPTEFKNSGYECRTKTNPFFKYGTFISTSRSKEVALSFRSPSPNSASGGSLFEIDMAKDTDGNEIIGADVSWISKFPDESEFLIARLTQLGINNFQYCPDQNFYTIKVSVEFFAHRGQMCFSLEHDNNQCDCDFQAGPRPIWMPPPEY